MLRPLGRLEPKTYGYKKKDANRRKTHKLICEECGEEFYVDNHWKDKRRFCSRTCASRNYHKKVKIDRGTRKCEYCGKEFEIKTQHKKQRYCSKKCSAIHRCEKQAELKLMESVGNE